MNPISQPLQLYSAKVCPFAQRTRLVLTAKNLEFEVHEIDIDNPPPDFRRLSPYGKVPLLVHGENRIWESAVINEYIEECFPQPAMMPTTPGGRAQARIWIDYANNYFVPLYYKLLLAQEPSAQEAIVTRLIEALHFIEEQGLSDTHTFWLGEQPGLVDFSFYPFFERFGVLAHFRNFKIPQTCARVARWLDAMKTVPAVSICGNPIDVYIARYSRYADGTVNNDTAREMRDK